jgi:hypothetical protein
MNLPTSISGTLKTRDIISAVNLLINEGIPTAMCCAGAICVRRELAPAAGSTNFDIHYTKSHVSIKQERTSTKYWNKDSDAKEIDAAYDTAFEDALIQFGNPDGWFDVRHEVEAFFLSRMRPLIGKSFVLTKQKPRRKAGEGVSHQVDPSTGAARGGHVRAIRCHETRTEKISKLLADWKR